MIFKEIIKYINLIVFGFFSYTFFSRLLGVKKNPRVTLISITAYLIFFDYIFLGRIVRNLLSGWLSSGLKWHLIYFLQITVSQICLTIIIAILFKGDVFKKVGVCTVYFIVWELVEYPVISILTRVFDVITRYSMTQIELPWFMVILMGILKYGITCLLLYVISSHCQNLNNNFPRKMSMMLLVPSLFILFVSEFILLTCNEIQVFNLAYAFEGNGKQSLLYENMDAISIFITSTFGLCADLIIVFGINGEMKQLLNHQQLEMRVCHYQDLEVNNQKLQGVRHDMKNHIITISGLLEDGDIGAAKEYMRKLTDESRVFSENIQSGNRAVDALLNTKSLVALNNSIKLTCDIRIPKLEGMSDFDLCIILGNAVDNALEACQRMDNDKERFISIQSSVVKLYFVLQVKNSTGEKEMHKDTLLSKKGNNETHGIGLENIRSTVIKNHGTMDVSLQDYTFSLLMMFPVKNRLLH